MLICGETNCSLYVGLSSFMLGCCPVNCPSNFMFNLTRCFVNDVIVFHIPLAVACGSALTLSALSRVAVVVPP